MYSASSDYVTADNPLSAAALPANEMKIPP